MAPKTVVKKINNILVSTTDSGYQDGRTWLESYKMFAKVVKNNKVQKHYCSCGGHSSRYDADVMQFCRKEDTHQFVCLPDTAELTQQGFPQALRT